MIFRGPRGGQKGKGRSFNPPSRSRDLQSLASKKKVIECSDYWHCLLASCLINAQPLPAHRPAADDEQMIGRCSVPRAVPLPILLTAYAHFGARLGAFFY